MSTSSTGLENARSRVFRPFAQWIITHRRMVMVAILGLTAFLASNVTRLQVDSNPKLWAPQKHPYIQTTDILDSVFGGRNLTVIGIAPKQGDIYQPTVLGKIRRLQDSLELLPNAVRHNVLSLAARKVKLVRGDTAGMQVLPMLDTVPMTPAGLAQLRAAVAAMPVYENVLVSPDGRVAAVVADFFQDSTTPNYITLNAGLRRIVTLESDSTVDILLGGLPIVGESADREFMKMPIFFGLALLVVMMVQFWSFRSIQGMLLPLVTGLLSVIWSLGLMGLAGVHLDPLNTTTPILVLAVAAGHAIQILKRYYEAFGRVLGEGLDARAANDRAVVESIVRVGPVMVVAGLIAAITFYSLAGTGIPMVQHFGIFAGSGVLATMVIEMTVIPALRSMLRPPRPLETKREQRIGGLDGFLGGIADALVGGRARMVVAAGLTGLALVGAGVFKLRIDNDFKLYFREDSQMRVDDRALNAAFGGTSSIQFLVTTPAVDGIKDPAVLRGMDKLQRFLESQRDVGKTTSVADLIKQMNQSMHADDPKFHAVPETRDLVSQYLFLYNLSGDPEDFNSYVDHDYRQATIWTFIKNESTSYADSLARLAQSVIAENFPAGVTVEMGGSLPQLMALNEVIVRDKVKNMVQMSLIVFVLGTIIMRSFVGGLFVVTPLFAVMLANFGVMGWMGIPLDITAITTAAMAIGIGADYEIYLLFRFRDELQRTGSVLEATRASMLTSGKAILLVAISVAAGYAVLQASDFAFYNTLSTMVMVTMGISAFFALFFLRALMMVFKPRFVFGKDRDKLFAAAAPKRPVLAAGIIALLASSSIAGAQAESLPTAREIMQRNFAVTKVSTLDFDMTMTLINDRGQRRERRSHTLVKLQPNGVDSKFLVRFNEPADVAGTALLQVEHSDADDDLWIYLPALKKSRRLVASNKKDSFVGSDFSYGDIAIPKVELWNHVLKGNETVDGANTWVIESTPANAAVRGNSGYSRKVTWVRGDSFLEAKVEYYDLANRLYKTQRVTKHQAVASQPGKWFALEREMTNVQTGHRTLIAVTKLDGTAALKDDLFSTRTLERP